MGEVPVANLKAAVGQALEKAFPGQVEYDVTIGGKPMPPARRMAREPSDTPLPLGDTESRRGADDRLRLLVERAERIEQERQEAADDLKDVFAEMKAVGYCTKTVKQVMKLRKMRPDDRAEMDALLDTYRAALGLG